MIKVENIVYVAIDYSTFCPSSAEGRRHCRHHLGEWDDLGNGGLEMIEEGGDPCCWCRREITMDSTYYPIEVRKENWQWRRLQ